MLRVPQALKRDRIRTTICTLERRAPPSEYTHENYDRDNSRPRTLFRLFEKERQELARPAEVTEKICREYYACKKGVIIPLSPR
jgi:hypothetical protein